MRTETLEKVQNLVSIARSVLHYEQALTKGSGESFNLFNILRVSHYEVRTHSPLLAELLDPKGSHGQGAVFLKHFCTGLGVSDFDSESARVRTEYHIGPQTAEEGGRIDILIRDQKGSQIIIENKIYAVEQPNQLARYRNYSAGAHLFFLTLYGDASQDANLPNELEVRNISYKTDILLWLHKCRKEATGAPGVRETIAQYISLVQQLTQQNTNTRMSQELTNAVLQNEATYFAYIALCKAENDVQTSILAKLKDYLNSASVPVGLKLNFPDSGMAERYAGFYFTRPAMDEQNVRMFFQFGQRDFGGCIFGFSRPFAGSVCPVEDKLFNAFKNVFSGAKKSPVWWVGYAVWDQHEHWDEVTMSAIQFGNLPADLWEIVMKMDAIFNEVMESAEPSHNT